MPPVGNAPTPVKFHLTAYTYLAKVAYFLNENTVT